MSRFERTVQHRKTIQFPSTRTQQMDDTPMLSTSSTSYQFFYNKIYLCEQNQEIHIADQFPRTILPRAVSTPTPGSQLLRFAGDVVMFCARDVDCANRWGSRTDRPQDRHTFLALAHSAHSMHACATDIVSVEQILTWGGRWALCPNI